VIRDLRYCRRCGVGSPGLRANGFKARNRTIKMIFPALIFPLLKGNF
jgi:hypothetical protein